VGYYSGRSNTSGLSNTFVGDEAGRSNTIGDYNSFLGNYTGYSNTTGNYNSFFGSNAGYSNTTGNYNSFFGYKAGHNNTTGIENTFIGDFAGYNNSAGRGNVFLGNEAGYHETGSNKLFIDNSDTYSPLIYGEFDNDFVKIIGKLGVGKTPTLDFEVDGYIRTDYFRMKSTAPQMRWYETDAAGDPNDYVYLAYQSNKMKILWRDDSLGNWTDLLCLHGSTGHVGIGNDSPSHLLDVGTSGAYCDGGAWVNGSSIAYKENIEPVSLIEAQNTLKDLKPIKYNYKENKEEEFLGFIAEEVPELVAMKDRKGLHTMDVVTVLTKIVQDQQKQIKNLTKLKEKYENLLKRIEKLEKEK
jgi:hypothetical protein